MLTLDSFPHPISHMSLALPLVSAPHPDRGVLPVFPGPESQLPHLVSGTHLEMQCFWKALNSFSSVAASCACGRISPQNCAGK